MEPRVFGALGSLDVLDSYDSRTFKTIDSLAGAGSY